MKHRLWSTAAGLAAFVAIGEAVSAARGLFAESQAERRAREEVEIGNRRRLRLLVAAIAALCLAGPAIMLVHAMPSFGAHPLPYGDAVNQAAPKERHVTNIVTAVNFDYRGIDTVGEEFMLVAAVTGAVVLLRGHRGENLSGHPGTVSGRPIPQRSDAVVLTGRLFGSLVVLFGFYVLLHPTVTPGGGFQGGAIVASGLLLLYLGEGYRSWRRLVRSKVADGLEGGGAALFAACGFLSLALGGAYLQNVLPFGQLRSMLSGGLMIVENLGVAGAVAGGFTVLFIEFLEETRAPEPGDDQEKS